MKDKLLRLIDAYIKDDEAINGTAKLVSSHGYERKFEGVFIMNSKNTKRPTVREYVFHNDKYIQKGIGYDFVVPKFETEPYVHYCMTFSFENQPPIQILNRSEELVVIKKGSGTKFYDNVFFDSIFFFNKIVELTYEFRTQKKPVHYLRCGSFEFDLTDEEVEEIYNKIENRRLEAKKAAEMAELNKRFEKYGIQ